MRSDMPCSLYGCVAMLHKPCTSPVHTTVFRTACRQLQLTNSSCTTCYSVRMHACLRVLTRSDMPCSLYQWCTNPEQAATTQQPDSSKQLHLTKQPAQFASRHLWTCCNVLLRTDKPCWLYQAVLACCTVHTTGTTPASRQLPLSTAVAQHAMGHLHTCSSVSVRSYTYQLVRLC
jgi:hypothetical protein